MNKELVYGYHQNQHFLKLGVYFVGFLFTFLVFVKPMGDIRYSFLAFLLFIPLEIIEVILYNRFKHELMSDKTEVSIMEVAEINIFQLRKIDSGFEFLGRVNGKIVSLKYYSLSKQLKPTRKRLMEYRRLQIEYYPKSKIVKDFKIINN